MDRSKSWVGLLAILILTASMPVDVIAHEAADLVFLNGKIYTVDSKGTVEQAVAVTGNSISFVGTTAKAQKLIGPETEVIDLHGKLMLPGFIDSHAHASWTVEELYSVQLYGLGSMTAYLAAVKEFATAHPEMTWIQGAGWSNTVAPGIGPLATKLDKAVPDRPATLSSEDGHSVWANSKALAQAGVTGTTPDPEGGVIERLPNSVSPEAPYGVPAGTLRENAADLVMKLVPDYTVQQYEAGLLAYQAEYSGRYGMTTVFDPMGSPNTNRVKAYEELASSGRLTITVRQALTLDPRSPLEKTLASFVTERAKHQTPFYKIVAVKFFEDGVVEGHTAYLDEPYADAAAYCGDPDYRGYPLWKQDALNQAFAAVDKAEFQIHVHAIGDAAAHATLDALEYARHTNGRHDWRPGITHLQLVDPDDYKRFADLGVTAVPQPYWFEKDDYYTYLQVPYLGLPRADYEYPMKSFFDDDVLVASASDFPVTYPPDPLDAIQTGVMRWFPGLVHEYPPPPSLEGVLWPEERVTVDQMIRSFTINGATAYYMAGNTGSIEVGKFADLIVISRDITTCSPKMIGRSKVLLTLFHGKRVFGTGGF